MVIKLKFACLYLQLISFSVLFNFVFHSFILYFIQFTFPVLFTPLTVCGKQQHFVCMRFDNIGTVDSYIYITWCCLDLVWHLLTKWTCLCE